MARRSSDGGQNIDTFAVCTNCSRLSNNLRVCDKCGSAFSEDPALCFSSDNPKRMRLDSASSTPSTAPRNGMSPSTPASPVNDLNTSSDVTSSAAATVSSSTTAQSVMPQQMYVNIHNPMLTNLRPVVANGSLAVVASSVAGNGNPNTQTTASANLGTIQSVLTNSVASSPLPVGNVSAVSASSNQQSTNLVIQLTVANGGGSVMTQPVSTLSTPMMNGNHDLSSPPVVQQTAILRPAGGGDNLFVQAETLRQEVFIGAHEIRIGEKKFKPISPISFKQDGILFTLKDYNFAPVLLNTRAIIQCRICLSLHYPIIFLYLEQSCMKQIRTIFKMADSQFSDKAARNIRRCITIFLNPANQPPQSITLPPNNQPATLLANLRQLLTTMLSTIKGGFKEISEEEAIDEILDTNERASSESPVVDGNIQNIARFTVNQPVSFSNAVTSLMTAPAYSLPAPRTAAMLNNSPQLLLSGRQLGTPAVQNVRMGSTTNNQYAVSANIAPVQANINALSQPMPMNNQPQAASFASAPPLVIPSNQRQWAMMQKTLVNGGVYHVQTHDGMVQNTEIRLECNAVRIGSYTTVPNGPLRVQADSTCTITFSLKDFSTPFTLQETDIKKVLICFDPVPVIFIQLTNTGCESLRARCHLFDSRDPGFNISSSSDKRRHFIFWLKSLTNDQRDALMQINAKPSVSSVSSKFANVKLCSELKTADARVTFVSILRSIRSENAGQGHYDRLPLDTIVQRVMTNDVNSHEEDEDDVVMTSEEVGIKCPYTQQVMKEPYRNKICGHNYERAAILEFISRKKPGTAKCPYAGCGNQTPLSPSHLEDNIALKRLIEQKQ